MSRSRGSNVFWRGDIRLCFHSHLLSEGFSVKRIPKMVCQTARNSAHVTAYNNYYNAKRCEGEGVGMVHYDAIFI